jgi:hypothetical protein
MPGLIACALMFLPFAIVSLMAASGDVPWWGAAAIGYIVYLFIAWCFHDGDSTP